MGSRSYRVPVSILGTFARGEAMELCCTKSITRPNAIAGKKIAVLRGTVSHYCLHLLMDKYSLPRGSVSLSFLDPWDMMTALGSGSVDGFVWQEPFLSRAVAIDPTRFHRRERGLVQLNACLVTSHTTLAEHRAALVRTLGALREANARIASDPAAAARICAKRSGIDETATTEAIGRMTLSLEFDVPTYKAEIADDAIWAIGDGLVQRGASFDLDSYFAPEVLAESFRT